MISVHGVSSSNANNCMGPHVANDVGCSARLHQQPSRVQLAGTDGLLQRCVDDPPPCALRLLRPGRAAHITSRRIPRASTYLCTVCTAHVCVIWLKPDTQSQARPHQTLAHLRASPLLKCLAWLDMKQLTKLLMSCEAGRPATIVAMHGLALSMGTPSSSSASSMSTLLVRHAAFIACGT